ncbi:MAG: nucleotidyl transferase AbiEii/AbiGii toxin family protein [Puniceicoccales bacterium]|jgi:predicted nucleotidyltransferase component of viral defense system|nr:nucleotidyl transferase AbiEii/AbiGii toxin family protein [Puniceicoccales bacterium]
MVLKGGTALLLGYGLPRYSEDLDFDAGKKLGLEHKIKTAAARSSATIEAIRLRKDTDTVRRYMVDFTQGGVLKTLKIEMSLRTEKIAMEDVRTIDGMRIYAIERLIAQKIHASEERAKVRDLFDLNFLLHKHGDGFTRAQLVRLQETTGEPGTLLAKYAADHADDHILQARSLDALVMSFCIQLDTLLRSGVAS